MGCDRLPTCGGYASVCTVRGKQQAKRAGQQGRSVVGVSLFAQRFPHLDAPTPVLDAVEVGGVDLVEIL